MANLVGYLCSGLSWDNTVPTKNPVFDIINMLNVELLTVKSLLNEKDLLITFSMGSELNMTEVSSYFGVQNYSSSLQVVFASTDRKYLEYLYACLDYPSQLLSLQIQERWETPLPVYNLATTVSSISTPSQILTYLDLAMNYGIDLYLMTQF
ncbi:unnamed protein product [Sphagnum balticum]